MVATTPEAVQLFHEGALALADVEANGMRVDMDYVLNARRKTQKKVKQLSERLRDDAIYKTWKREYGTKAKLTSGEQLAHILFNKMGYKCRERTAKEGKASGKESNLVDVDLPFVRDWTKMAKLEKADGTFMAGIERFATKKGKLWFIHPNFNLNIAASYRSTSSDPNFQNYPTRNDNQAKLVRSSFIPRKGHRLVESDFSGIEVGIACCYNHDPRLIRDYTEGDMHRDMAAKCFMIDAEKGWWKEKGELGGYTVRYCGKNMFVFPNFYGSYYVDCARNLWEAIERLHLHSPDGEDLYAHLKSKGIKRLGDCDPQSEPRKGTFEHHIKKVEDYLWNERYSVYTEWKKGTWASYQAKGYCKLHTGFICSRDSDGLPMNRKQVINYQIQGAAFHCLLWALVQINRWLRENKMKTKIVSQIHDSIIADVHEDELEDYVAKINEIMTVDLPRYWKWIIVKLSAEVEITEVDGNWYEKQKYELQ